MGTRAGSLSVGLLNVTPWGCIFSSKLLGVSKVCSKVRSVFRRFDRRFDWH